MTRIKSPHDFHEVTVPSQESICLKCKTQTSKICSWCGMCYTCHHESREKDYWPSMSVLSFLQKPNFLWIECNLIWIGSQWISTNTRNWYENINDQRTIHEQYILNKFSLFQTVLRRLTAKLTKTFIAISFHLCQHRREMQFLWKINPTNFLQYR